jgi:hypothetical protein
MSDNIRTSSEKYHRNLAKLAESLDIAEGKDLAETILPIVDAIMAGNGSVEQLNSYLNAIEPYPTLSYIVNCFIKFYPD